MTKEEAIKILNTVLFFGKCDCPKKEIEECLKMAIKAIEQELCGDVISKKQLERELNAQIAVKAISRETALDMLEHLPTVDAIIIPKNATNGDMIKALFPNVEIHTGEDYCDERDVVFNLSDEFVCVSMDWWNEPYKKAEEQEHD